MPRAPWRSDAQHRSVNIDTTTLVILVPVILLQLGLLIWGLYDLTRPERRVRGDNKIIWGLVVIFIGIIGPLVYFIVGRDVA
jgi:hypothetical protein